MFLGGNETMTAQEKSTVKDFKDKATEFSQLWNLLSNQSNVVAKATPDIQKEYNDLMNSGSFIKESIQEVTNMIDKAAAAYQSVRDWISNTFGLSGIAIDQKASQLGIIPLLAIGVIAAAVAAMGKWVIDAYTLNKKLDKLAELQSQGYTAQAAADVLAKMDGGIFSGASALIPLALLSVGALFLLKRP
jgi:hypothetical protein